MEQRGHRNTLWVVILILILVGSIPFFWLVQQNRQLETLGLELQEKDQKIWNLMEEKERLLAEQEKKEEELEALLLEMDKRTDEKRVYLTFDDGPSPVTADLLDLLKEKGILATFFVNGAHPSAFKDALLQRIVLEGHSLGNHTYSHDYSKIYTSREDFWRDFMQMEEHIIEVTGTRPQLVRFPGGSRGSYARRSRSVMEELRKDMDRMGYVYVDWNVLGGDVESDDPQYYIEQVLRQVRGKKTATVLFHDTAANPEILEALPLIIEELQQRGYLLLPMDPTEFYTRY